MKTIINLIAIPILAALCLAAEPQNIPISQLGKNYRLIGKLHVPLGEVVTVEGVVVEGPYKGYEGGFNLRVQRIQGKTTQEDIQIPISPFFYKWGEKATVGGNALPKIEMGKTYEMEGYETGGYTGVPSEVFRKGAVIIQTTNHYFREVFTVTKAKQIEPINYTPGMFEGQRALIQGMAVSREGKALMIGNGWTVSGGNTAWPKDIIGKQIETWGMYKDGGERKTFTLIDGTWRLVQLEDQVGRKVELRGRARSLNGEWWFHYRGVDLYVENMQNLPGWNVDNHWKSMIIRGRLEKAQLPSLDQISEKEDRDLKEYFIVKDAEWTPLPDLLGPERPFTEPD